MTENFLITLHKAIVDGDEKIAGEMAKAAIESGVPANDILKKGLIPGIREIGELFGKGEAYLPELIVSGKAMEATIVYLDPLFTKEDSTEQGHILIGTVAGDVHDIGKNIVSMMMKGNGWKVTDLGVDVSPEDFCTAIRNGTYDILGLSALLTTTMANLDLTVMALKEAGLRENVKIMIGGAPVTQEYADKIGVDAFGEDAWDAVNKAERLLALQTSL